MRLTTPRQTVRYLSRHTPLATCAVEEFWAIALNADKQVLGSTCVFRGTVDWCLIHPRDVFRFALQHNASSLLVAHNHPSGRPQPSAEDIAVTRQLLLAAAILQIPVLDHVIIAGRRYFSFLESGALTAPQLKDLLWPSGQSPDRCSPS
jgi:DNA repair protein RadC